MKDYWATPQIKASRSEALSWVNYSHRTNAAEKGTNHGSHHRLLIPNTVTNQLDYLNREHGVSNPSTDEVYWNEHSDGISATILQQTTSELTNYIDNSSRIECPIWHVSVDNDCIHIQMILTPWNEHNVFTFTNAKQSEKIYKGCRSGDERSICFLYKNGQAVEWWMHGKCHEELSVWSTQVHLAFSPPPAPAGT